MLYYLQEISASFLCRFSCVKNRAKDNFMNSTFIHDAAQEKKNAVDFGAGEEVVD